MAWKISYNLTHKADKMPTYVVVFTRKKERVVNVKYSDPNCSIGYHQDGVYNSRKEARLRAKMLERLFIE